MGATIRGFCTLVSELIMLNFAKEHRNRTVEHYGCLPTKKLIYEWKKSQRELQYLEKNRHHLLVCHKVATMRRRDGRVVTDRGGGGGWGGSSDVSTCDLIYIEMVVSQMHCH